MAVIICHKSPEFVFTLFCYDMLPIRLSNVNICLSMCGLWVISCFSSESDCFHIKTEKMEAHISFVWYLTGIKKPWTLKPNGNNQSVKVRHHFIHATGHYCPIVRWIKSTSTVMHKEWSFSIRKLEEKWRRIVLTGSRRRWQQHLWHNTSDVTSSFWRVAVEQHPCCMTLRWPQALS